MEDEKFNTCKFRAAAEDVYTFQTCCKIETGWGFHCHKLNLEGVKKELCAQCLAYEKKENLD